MTSNLLFRGSIDCYELDKANNVWSSSKTPETKRTKSAPKETTAMNSRTCIALARSLRG